MENLSDARCLITGGNGFVGSHLAHRLLADGAEVYLFDIFDRVERNPYLEDIWERVSTVPVDLTDAETLREEVRAIEPENVFHLGALIGRERSLDMADRMIHVNILGTVNLLQALENVDYSVFIHVGTSEEYGDNLAPFREDMLVKPTSPYSASKASSEIFCLMAQRAHGWPMVLLRLFNLYGPGQMPNMLIPELIVTCLLKKDFKATKGEQGREVNFVEDAVEGFVRAACSKKAVGEVINVGCGREYKIKEIIEKVLDLMGRPIEPLLGALPYRENEIWHMYCDNTKAKEILGWKPRHSLEQGLRKTIAWYREMYEKRPNAPYFRD